MQHIAVDSLVAGNSTRRLAQANATSAAGVNPGAIDLNLLRVLDAIMQERSLTRAGRKLGLSQPAASHALARLRHMLGDELFIRTPEGMQPTPRAERIAQPIREALTGTAHDARARTF